MNYAANKVIATALRDRAIDNSGRITAAVYVHEGIVERISDPEMAGIAAMIAEGLTNADDIDSVDCAEIGRRIVMAIVEYTRSCVRDEIQRAEDAEANELTQTELDDEHRTADNTERAADMRRAA